MSGVFGIGGNSGPYNHHWGGSFGGGYEPSQPSFGNSWGSSLFGREPMSMEQKLHALGGLGPNGELPIGFADSMPTTLVEKYEKSLVRWLPRELASHAMEYSAKMDEIASQTRNNGIRAQAPNSRVWKELDAWYQKSGIQESALGYDDLLDLQRKKTFQYTLTDLANPESRQQLWQEWKTEQAKQFKTLVSNGEDGLRFNQAGLVKHWSDPNINLLKETPEGLKFQWGNAFRHVVVERNIKNVMEPLSTYANGGNIKYLGMAGLSAVGIGLAGWSVISATTDSIKAEKAKGGGFFNCALAGSWTFATQGTKVLACWEIAGLASKVATKLLLPLFANAGWVSAIPVVGGVLAGAAVASLAYVAISKLLPDPPKVYA